MLQYLQYLIACFVIAQHPIRDHISPPAMVIALLETESLFKVSFDKMEKPGFELVTPALQGKLRNNHGGDFDQLDSTYNFET